MPNDTPNSKPYSEFLNLTPNSKTSPEGVICRLQVAGCRLQVAGCRLQVAGAGAGCRLQVQVAGYTSQVAIIIITIIINNYSPKWR